MTKARPKANSGEKRPPWRPSKYEARFCEMVIEWGALGKSKAWIASEIGVVRETLNEWAKVHPDFSVALTRALELSQRWWEDAGQEGMTSDKFNGGVWSRNMAARFPADWRERQSIDQTVKAEVSADDRLEEIHRKIFRIATVQQKQASSS